MLPVRLRLTGPDGLPGAAAIQVGFRSLFSVDWLGGEGLSQAGHTSLC